jgi:hypothetical protein
MLALQVGAGREQAWTEAVPLFTESLAAASPAPSPDLPPFLIEILAFPYRYGTPFVAALYSRGGWPAVDAAFKRPPVSSEQILHPERYAEPADAPERLERALLPGRIDGMEQVHQMVLGEFVTRLALQPRAGEERAASAAAGWDGDRAALYEAPRRSLLVWLSAWDDAGQAAEFAEALRRSPAEGSLVEARGARVLHLSVEGEIEAGTLLDIAAGLWRGWS